MILFNSQQKDRNYHRSKKKLFNHEIYKNSKQKPISFEQTSNQSNNVIKRDLSPSKKQNETRSPSRGSKRSKKSGLSDKDKQMTKQMFINTIQYIENTQTQKKRQFLSPNNAMKQKQIDKNRRSGDNKILRRRSKQLQKEQPIRRKQKNTRLFEKIVTLPNYPQKTPPHPERTPPRIPKNTFLQQKGEINQLQVNQLQQLQKMRQQNEFYKLIYKTSIEKMKRLQNHIEKQKEDYKNTKQKFQRQLRDLKYKVQRADKKVSIGHIYSYDQKQMLRVQPDKIITQTDNEASEMTHMNDKSSQKDTLPSRLSIDSS